MQVKPQVLKIGYVDFYEKVNPCQGEKYISVENYNKIYTDGNTKNAEKTIVVYDTKENEILDFRSVKEASDNLKIARTQIWIALKSRIPILIKKRFSFKRKIEKKERKVLAEYSNRQF